eukprot:12242788-Alexandrium_andersonii.AAC.1
MRPRMRQQRIEGKPQPHHLGTTANNARYNQDVVKYGVAVVPNRVVAYSIRTIMFANLSAPLTLANGLRDPL